MQPVLFLLQNLEVPDILSIFAASNAKSMEEKRYPILEEEENIGMVCEPVGATAYADSDDNEIPIVGPSSWEEAMADLDESEREFETGKCIPWENVLGEIKERYKSYAY